VTCLSEPVNRSPAVARASASGSTLVGAGLVPAREDGACRRSCAAHAVRLSGDSSHTSTRPARTGFISVYQTARRTCASDSRGGEDPHPGGRKARPYSGWGVSASGRAVAPWVRRGDGSWRVRSIVAPRADAPAAGRKGTPSERALVSALAGQTRADRPPRRPGSRGRPERLVAAGRPAS
jgi:hypothetical protein